ncbi:PASTA domain-containing protein [uncultured Corynebacterium sp.]|uniref:Stk1 family PASTA domain-containing Ser/Thr kinase n=1 Tax=uncultured Corynebacterium sp. TaxID=159447 RepID=UPI0028E52BC7|nr:PASTA domain-containing protein [uncultured Corynebacterium sp.]
MSELIANRYELGSVVGSGGMSVVYSATDTLLGREVAVKMLRSELARDANFRERFRREAQNAGRLNHPAIVAIYDTGETLHDGQSTPYIVMELVKGRNLKDIVADGGPLSPDEAATTLIPVCEALQVSHDAGIVHRDIKPANVMITNTGVVKIMDFGIARALDDVTSHMTQTSAVIGTAQYLSPEQARGKPVDGRSDLYALGCLMYDIMVGHPPFDGDTPFAVAYQHVQEDPTPPSEFIPDLSPTAALNVDAVVLTAMAKHPGDRYQTAVEMAADLQRLEKNLVTMAARQYVDHDPEGATNLPGPAGIAAAELAAGGAAGAAGLAGAAGAVGAGMGAAGFAGAGAGADAADAMETTVVPAVSEEFPPKPTPPMQSRRPTHAATADPRMSQGRSPQGRTAGQHAAQAGQVQRRQPAELEPDDYYDSYEDRPRKGLRIALIVVALLSLGVVAALTYQYFSPTILTPKSNVTVPDLRNQTKEDALAALEKLGLKTEVVNDASADVQEDHVVGTDPTANSTVKSGSTITVTVSSGRENTSVPDLSGKTTAEASAILKKKGLDLDPVVREGSSPKVERGKIMEQNPSAGTQVSKGSKVTITVSTGEATTRVPVVTGMQWSQAEGNLTSLGFEPVVEFVDGSEPDGTVISVDGEGTQMPAKSKINVKVSNGSLIQTPNLTNMTVDAAYSALQAAGWKGNRSQIVLGDPVKTGALVNGGRIAQQTPAAGSPVRKDGTVTVQLWEFDITAIGR